MTHLKNNCTANDMILGSCCGLECTNCGAHKCGEKSLLERIGDQEASDDWVKKAESGKIMRIM